MVSPTVLLAAVSAVTAITIPRIPIERSAQICYDGETSALLCYTAPDNVPQDVSVADVTFIAAYLRSYGRQLKAGRFFTMLAADTPDCDEWTLYSRNSALALAKHITTNVNSSVLFEDIATTIDGGDSTQTTKLTAIASCLSDGGSLGVLVNATHPSYNTTTYKASGYTPQGVLVKIVSNSG